MGLPASGSGADVSAAGLAPLVGTRLGSYLVGKPIGEGGAGVVYMAEHTVIGRQAAIKVLGLGAAPDPDAVSRFFTEARAANQIRHPNIVEVTDLGATRDGRPYIVMEFLEGETLSDRLDRARVLDPATAVRIARQVASALGAAHERGLVHRDLKPANIFLRQHPDYPDFVKVLDFGIAKLVKPGDDVGHHTRVGTLMGTPAYMSPEQCLGEATLDHRSDIYSLGVVIYLMITGRLPFEEDQLGRLILSHVNQTPQAPAQLNPRVPHELSACVLKALQKRPDDRFATMRAMRQSLDAALGFERTPTPAFGVPVTGAAGLGGRAATPGLGVPAYIGGRSEASGPTMIGGGRVPSPSTAATPTYEAATAVSGFSASPSALMRDDGVALKLVAMVRERLAADNLDLPELSPTAATCLQSLRNPGLGFGELALVVDKDSRLASQIIRLANSAAFPSRSPATSLAQSIGRLGAQALQEALVEFGARPVLEARDPRIKDAYRRPWSRALAIAMTAERLAQELAQPDLGTPLYLAGILQDIGKPLVAAFLLQVERQTSGPRGPKWMTDDVWQRAIGATFRAVSEAVAKRWHLPAATLRAIGRSAEYEAEAGRAPGAILRFAAAIADREGFYSRRADLDDLDARLGEGRSHLGLDDKTERRATVALKERVLLLAGIRGN